MARMMTVDEAAEYLRVTPYTVRKWLRKGKIPGRKIGRMYRIVEAELESLLAQRAGDPEGPQPAERRTGAMDLLGSCSHVPLSSEDLVRERHEDDAGDEGKRSYQRWHALSREEKRARLQAGRGAFAHVPFSSEDLVRERRRDAEREDAGLQEHARQ